MKVCVRILNRVIGIIDIPNDKPKLYSDWECEDINRFEALVHFAYDNEVDYISWFDERVETPKCI